MGCCTFMEQLIAIHGSVPVAKSRTLIWKDSRHPDTLNTLVQLGPSPECCDLAASV